MVFVISIINQSKIDFEYFILLPQFTEYFIDRRVLGLSKQNSHTVLEYRGDPIEPGNRSKFDSGSSIVIPTVVPTLMNVCKLIQLHYGLKVWLEAEKSGDCLHINLPLCIGTIPFRIPNSDLQPKIEYDVCSGHVEGGMYIGPEFQLGQVYDGSTQQEQPEVVLYRPVYVCVKPRPRTSTQHAHHAHHHHHHYHQRPPKSHRRASSIEQQSEETRSPGKQLISSSAEGVTTTTMTTTTKGMAIGEENSSQFEIANYTKEPFSKPMNKSKDFQSSPSNPLVNDDNNSSSIIPNNNISTNQSLNPVQEINQSIIITTQPKKGFK